MIPIFQMKKFRPRSFRNLPRVTQQYTTELGFWDPRPCSLAPELMLLTAVLWDEFFQNASVIRSFPYSTEPFLGSWVKTFRPFIDTILLLSAYCRLSAC